MKEFAFDVNLSAVIRVKAEDLADARKMLEGVDCCSPEHPFITRGEVSDGVFCIAEITEVSMMGQARFAHPFEIDGVTQER